MALYIRNQTFQGEYSEVEAFLSFKCDTLCPTSVLTYSLTVRLTGMHNLCLGFQVPFPAQPRTSRLSFLTFFLQAVDLGLKHSFLGGVEMVAGVAARRCPALRGLTLKE